MLTANLKIVLFTLTACFLMPFQAQAFELSDIKIQSTGSEECEEPEDPIDPPDYPPPT